MITQKYISKNKRVQIHAEGESIYEPITVTIEGFDTEGYREPGNYMQTTCDFDDIEPYYAPKDEYERIY